MLLVRAKHLLRRFVNAKSNGAMVPNPNCSEFEVNNRLVSEFVIRKLVPAVGYQPFPLDELMLLTAAMCWLRPSHVLEWGTNVGKSARVFYETAKCFGLPTEIHSVDLPDSEDHAEHPRGSRGALVRHLKEVRLHQGDGLTTSLAILEHAKDVRAPLFFLDGDHSYGSVKRELREIILRVPSANILVHDTFYQSKDSRYNIRPYQAIVDTVTTRSPSFKMIQANLGLPGMALLYQV
jgi:cephalosporin hydroxylase